MLTEIRYEIPGAGAMRGWADTGPAMEFAVVEHVLHDGSIMRETVIRPVEPAPAPEAPADEG